MRLGMGSDVLIREKSFRWPLRAEICGVENVSIGVLLSPRCLDRCVGLYAATKVTAVGASGARFRKIRFRKQETPCPALRSLCGGSPGMVTMTRTAVRRVLCPGRTPFRHLVVLVDLAGRPMKINVARRSTFT